MNYRIDRIILILFLMFTGAVAFVPYLVQSEYQLRVVTVVVLWVGIAGCWNMMSGYTGYIDFGPVVYFGIGSYVVAIAMTKYSVPFFPSLFVSGCISAFVAFLVGIPTLRLRGAYFAIATFAFAEAMKQITLEFDRTFNVSFFQGSDGITLPISNYENSFFFYCILPVTFLVVFTHYFIEHSKFGYALKAIKEAESAAEISGVNTTANKLVAYVMSAFFLGLFGAIEAYWITYITPSDVFNVQKTVQMVIMTLLGGMGTFLGPVVGATFLTLISETLGAQFVEYYLIMIGAIIIVAILIMPSGIIGGLKIRKKLRFI